MSYLEKPDGSRIAIEWLRPKLTEPGRGRHIRLFELSIPAGIVDIKTNLRGALDFAERIIEAGWGGPADTTFGLIGKSPTPDDPNRVIVAASVEEMVIDMKPTGDGQDMFSPEESLRRQLADKHYRGVFDPKTVRIGGSNAGTSRS